MAVDFQSIKIERVIFHQIFKRESVDVVTEPHYNEKCAEFEYAAKLTLKKRMVKSLGNKSHALKMQISDTGQESVYKLISDYWDTNKSENEFIALSKRLTFLLASAQKSKTIDGGIVVVVEGKVSQYANRYICVIKADIQDGFNIDTVNGEQDMKYISNLLLTPAQKLQKMGIFIDVSQTVGHVKAEDIETYIYDSNTDANSTIKKALYFYNTFLGLSFSSDNDMITHKFYKLTKEFINECEEISSGEKHKLQSELIAYLQNGANTTVNPASFADSYIENPVINDSYIRHISAGQIPIRDTLKDLGIVGRHMSKRSMFFDNSIKITAPAEGFDRSIEVSENEDGDTIIKIKGKLIRE